MTMDYACWLYNNIRQQDSGLTPLELWSRSTFQATQDTLSHACVWGSPVFVLEPKFQKGGIKIPKWAARSHHGLFVGFSKNHAATVGLILNHTTGSITPQFHVVYDDYFSTTAPDGDIDYSKFTELLLTPNARYLTPLDPDYVPDLSDEWLTPSEREARDAVRQQMVTGHISPVAPLERENRQQQERSTRFENTLSPQDNSSHVRTPLFPNVPTNIPTPAPPPAPDPLPAQRPQRIRRYTKFFDPGTGSASQWRDNDVARMAHVIEDSYFQPVVKNKLFLALTHLDQDISSVRQNPLCYKTKKQNDPDTPNFHEAMTGPHTEEFKQAMDKELEGLIKRKTWSLVPRANHKMIPGTWAFKIKRKPDGSLSKSKDRFCVCGDIQRKKQESILDTDPYAPVIGWSTI